MNLKKLIHLFCVFLFLINSLFSQTSFCQEFHWNLLPKFKLSPKFDPPLLLGMSINENPLLLNFIVSPGDSNIRGDALNQETLKMVKYFLASLTIPDDEMWVNLSPNEPDKITSKNLGFTTMGKDLLEQDYLLKQITSSIINPENEIGTKFWDRVYKLAYEKFNTTDVPINIFNKVWIVPKKAVLFEEGQNVFVVARELQVLTESDYSSWKNTLNETTDKKVNLSYLIDKNNDLATKVVKEIIIPELEKEVNTGTYFAKLRQIYNAMILAKWYKENLKANVIGKFYVDQNKIKGIKTANKNIKEKIYNDYIQAFRKGSFNFIREEYDPQNQEIIAKRYFSGGLLGMANIELERLHDIESLDKAQLSQLPQNKIAPFNYTIALMDTGKNSIDSDLAMTSQVQGKNESFSAFEFTQQDAKILFDNIKNKEHLMGHVGEEFMLLILGKLGAIQGAGGLGFLLGEVNASLKKMLKIGCFSTTFAYKHYKDPKTGEWVYVDWKNMPNVYPLMIREGNGQPQQLSFNVSFKGAYNGDPLGTNYKIVVYYANVNGNLMTFLDVPDHPNLFHHLYDNFNHDEKRWIQYGLEARALVEFYKRLGTAPDVLHLNEGHMSFVYPAIRNDIDYHRQQGTKSIFEGIKIIFTNHTPVLAGIPIEYDIAKLKRRVGEDLIPDYMLTDGVYNSLFAIVQNALTADQKGTGVQLLINGVSKEHGEDVLIKVLLKNFPDAKKVVTYIQNGSDENSWMSPELLELIKQQGINNITGKMLLDLAERHKKAVNSELKKLYGDSAPQFNQELLEKRPIIGFLRRWVEYKEAAVILSLIKWITGDKDKNYPHPVIPDIDILNDTEKLEKFLQKAEWTEGPGLEMLIIAGGKGQGELKGEEWLQAFKNLSNEPEMKGKLVVIDDTGFPIMQQVTWASTFLYNVPDLTLEASGTSQQRSGFMGRPIIAILGAGMSAQIKHGINGSIINPFPLRSRELILEDFNPQNEDKNRLPWIREQFRKRVPILAAAHIRQLENMYYYNRKELEKWFLNAFRYAIDTVSIERMVKEYEALGISMKNSEPENALENFEAMRRKMYLENLFVKIYRWHPELRTKGISLENVKELFEEVWTPLDDLELGNGMLNKLVNMSYNELILFSENMGLTKKEGEELWIVKENQEFNRYLDLLEEKDEENAQVALEIDNDNKRKVGGIDFDSKLLDMQIKRNDDGIPLPLSQQPVQDINLEGFIPVILNVESFNFSIPSIQ